MKTSDSTLSFNFKKIGIIHTPYESYAPYQPVESDDGDFRIVKIGISFLKIGISFFLLVINFPSFD